MKYWSSLLFLSIGFNFLLAQPNGMQSVKLFNGKFQTFIPVSFQVLEDSIKLKTYPEGEVPDFAYIDTTSQQIIGFRLTPYAANEDNLNIYMKTFVESFVQIFPKAFGIEANFVPFKKRRVGFIEMINPVDTTNYFSFQYFTHISDSLFLANVSGNYINGNGIKQLSRLVFQTSTYRDKPIGQVSSLAEQLICDGEVTARETIYKPVIRSKETDEGIVFVEIKIDREGRVVHTRWLQEDSTTQNEVLVKHCLDAASQYRFNAKIDAPTEQIAALKFTFSNPKN